MPFSFPIIFFIIYFEFVPFVLENYAWSIAYYCFISMDPDVPIQFVFIDIHDRNGGVFITWCFLYAAFMT